MMENFKKLATEYNVSISNVISIAINRYGILSDDISDHRIRFQLKILNDDKPTFFAVGVNTMNTSPFILKNNKLYLEDTLVGEATEIQKDTCTSTYFRNDKKVITFNSNSRSKCTGCKFCGTYHLDNDDGIDFSTSYKIKDFFTDLLLENDIDNMNKIENITICTGCFENEQALVEHILNVHEGVSKIGFNGSINYIGSQLRSFDNLKLLKKEISDFGLYLTIEKFLDREKIMRKEKSSLTLEKAKELLSYSCSLDITTTFLYILGLENLDVFNYYMTYFKDSINKFPIVQIFQNYIPEHELYRCEEGKNIEYYLKARKNLNEIFSSTNTMEPKEWECFRSLYPKKEKVLKR